MAVGEHSLQLATNKPAAEPLPNHSHGNRVFDLVSQQGAALTIVEKAMAVIPGYQLANVPDSWRTANSCGGSYSVWIAIL